MKRKAFFLLAYICTAILAPAQQLRPAVISAGGDLSKGGGISLEWTLGEPVTESFSGADKWYTQGFHQPLLVAKGFPSAADPEITGYTLTIAPNPVQSFLNLTIKAPGNEKLFFLMTDISGRRLPLQAVSTGSQTLRLDLSELISGFYLLEARSSSGRLVYSYKLVKVH